MKNAITTTVKAVGFLLIAVMLTSCYNVRLRTVEGVPMPDPVSDRTDYYRDMMVIEKDTVISMGAVEKDFTLLLKECGDEGIHTVEYRTTLGGILLSGITFGRKRQVKLKYVCMKPSN